jgi:hypothetical protein
MHGQDMRLAVLSDVCDVCVCLYVCMFVCSLFINFISIKLVPFATSIETTEPEFPLSRIVHEPQLIASSVQLSKI